MVATAWAGRFRNERSSIPMAIMEVRTRGSHNTFTSSARSLAVHRIQVIPSTRVTAQFGAARQQCAQDVDQPIDADGVRKGRAVGCLAVEIAAIVYRRATMSQRHGECASDFGEHRPQWLPAVHVLMGVNVGGILAHQAEERCQLTRDLGCYRGRCRCWGRPHTTAPNVRRGRPTHRNRRGDQG